MLFELGQRRFGKLLQLGVFAVLGVFAKQLDSLLVSHDLVVCIGLVEILTFTELEDHGFCLVHQRGIVGYLQILLLAGDFGQFLIGLGVVIDHFLGKGPDVFRVALVQRQLGGFDFRDTLGRGFVNEVLTISRQ